MKKITLFVLLFSYLNVFTQIANQPSDLVVCDDNNDGSALFDLTAVTSEVLGGQNPADFTVTYYATQNDADLAVNALPTSFTNFVNPQTIYVRLEENATGNYDTTSFNLAVNPNEIEVEITSNDVVFIDFDNDPATPEEAILCGFESVVIEADSPSADTFVWYKDGFVLVGETSSILTVTDSGMYQVQSINSQCGTDALSQIVDIKLYKDPGSIASQSIEVCDGIENDGIADFNLDTLSASLGLSSNFTVSYYTNIPDANQALNLVGPIYTSANATIYMRVEDINAFNNGFIGCRQLVAVELVVSSQPNAGNDGVVELCSSDNSIDLFDFLGGSPQLGGAWSPGLASGTGIFTPSIDSSGVYTYTVFDDSCSMDSDFATVTVIVNPSPTFNIDDISICEGSSIEVDTGLDPSEYSFLWSTGETTPTTIVSEEGNYWVVVESFTGCLVETGFSVTFNGPSFNSPNPTIACDFSGGNGFAEFDLTQVTPEIVGAQADLSVTYYETQAAAEEGVTWIVDEFPYVNINPFYQVLFFRVEGPDGCYSVGILDLIVSGVSPLPAISDYVVCDEDQDGFTEFLLQSKNNEILVNQENSELLISYHLTGTDAENLTNAISDPFINTTNPQTIFVAVTDIYNCGFEIQSFSLVADQTCAPCQTIIPSIDSTVPEADGSGIVNISIGETVEFNGSTTFSEDGTGATYSWDFGDGNIASGINVSNTYTEFGSYTVTFSVEDTNPLGCQETTSIEVIVSMPIVSVNSSLHPESFFSPEELIANVLVTEGCFPVDIFTSQVNGNPSEIDTKNYGYFNRGSAVNFPFEEGIILTTGIASQAGNSENTTVVSNDNGQLGDLDLETALGIVNTNDAAFIKFNFVPTTNEINFRYLMASEEYDGNTECNFADSFAFLLREVGASEYINLAVLPDGTPVSVTNINDSGLCTSNPEFFEGYNIGDTNYGGRTAVLTASASVIPDRTYEIKLVIADQGDSIWDTAIFLEAGSFNLGEEPCADVGFISVSAFNDSNSDGDFGTDELRFMNGSFTYEKNNDGVVNVVNSSTGSFTILSTDENDTYDITYVINEDYADCYTQNVTSFNDVSVTFGSLTQLDFPIEDNLTCEDLGVYLVNPFASPRPGFEHTNFLYIENLSGTTIASGSVEFALDDDLIINNTSLSNTNMNITTSGTGFTLNFTDLGPGVTEYVDISLLCPATIPLGEIVTNTASYTTAANDSVLENNTSTLSEVVIGSYDPNDKMEVHGPQIVYDDFINTDEYLYYTIRFQNLGTAEAIFVRIEDELDTQLDEETFQMLRSSHDYTITRTGNNLEWFFDNINLPAEQDDAEGSNGFVYFKIKPKPGYAIGDFIPNDAAIYFDFNAPVITNTFTSEFVETLSTNNPEFASITMHPNPAKDSVTIDFQNSLINDFEVSIVDIQGKIINVSQVVNASSIALNLASLNSGMYFIKIKNTTNTLVKKLVIK